MSFILGLSFLLGFFLSFPFFIIIYRRTTKDRDARNNALTALRKLDEIMMASLGLEDVAQRVTDAIAFELKFEIGVLALVDEKIGVLKRVAMSRTPVGLETHKYLPVPYTQITIPLTATDNLLIQCLRDGKRKVTDNLYMLFKPALDLATSERIQERIGIKTSLIYPVVAKGKRIGVMIFSIKRTKDTVSEYEFEMVEKLIDVMGIALDNAHVYQQLRDTTHQLAEANKRLKELDKLKDDFVSVASHELRTPMTAIRSYVWMALHRSDIPLSQRLERYLYRTLLSTERLINLVNDMLNLSRIEAGIIEINPVSFSISELVKDILEEIKPKADEKRLELVIMDHKLPNVFADPDKTREIILNLLGNSLKFSYPGGNITIDFFTDGKMVEVSVRDSGSGISKDDLSRLFHKFARLDNSYVSISTSGGTGLGLYISKNLVELMHGKIWVISDGMDKGSTFTFSLPIATEEILKHAQDFRVKPKDGFEAKPLEPVAI